MSKETNEWERLDEILKQYSIVRYDNPNGIYANSNNDWLEAKAAIASYTAKQVLDGKRDQTKLLYDCKIPFPIIIDGDYIPAIYAKNQLTELEQARKAIEEKK